MRRLTVILSALATFIMVSAQSYTQQLRDRAVAGDIESMAALADCYYQGSGIAQDCSEAVRWWRKAARKGDADAMYHLGYCYQQGTGVKKDLKKTVRWWHRAAESGHRKAMYLLAMCYDYGTGVEKDSVKARHWYAEELRLCREMAEKGDVMSMCQMGHEYEDGLRTERNYPLAVMWYRRAAACGSYAAMAALADMYLSGTGVRQDKAKAQLLNEAAEAAMAEDHERAMSILRRALPDIGK